MTTTSTKEIVTNILSREKIVAASEYIRDAAFCIVTCGAGMSADSGVPTYRDANGFWRDYPLLEKRGIDYRRYASPDFFREYPDLAWEVTWDMITKYRNAVPHDGYTILKQISEEFWNDNLFVVTSNVDSLFRKANFSGDSICEFHGSMFHLQCIERCTDDIWYNDLLPEEHPVPKCIHCGKTARPNVLFFYDDWYLNIREKEQSARLEEFIRTQKHTNNGVAQGVIIEVGAGTALPVIRNKTDAFRSKLWCPSIRVNPESHKMHGGFGLQVGISAGCKDFFTEIKEILYC